MINEKKDKYCVHCGDLCLSEAIEKEGRDFCCSGCLFVYELLNDLTLQKNYDISKLKSISPKPVKEGEYDFLDDEEIKEKLLLFSINGKAKVIFSLPNIYCSACIWLLENITRMDTGIKEAKVNFLKKEISILFIEEQTSLKKIAALLASIGYRPKLNMANLERKSPVDDNRSLIIKLGIAGFCFANIMLFALPEYLALGNLEENIRTYLRFLSLIASVPVLYAASDYFRSAIISIKMKIISIDIPLSLGIIALFLRSSYEVLTFTGPGYSDSLAGLLFFLLLGKVFQKKTFYTLSFDRDYKSYFPMSVIRKKGEKEEYVAIKDIKIGNTLIIRNNEIIPTDSILMTETAILDYSFVTGESIPVPVKFGEKIYSGAKHIGSTVEVQVVKNFQQSYMTELWDNQLLKDKKEVYTSDISNKMAKYFTILVLLVAFGGFLFWVNKDIKLAMNAFVAVLIVACPCALAISTPFSYGTALRIFSKFNLFLKNDKIVEKIADVDTIIFDKTGTLTESEKSEISYTGKPLSEQEFSWLKSAARNSTHPYSRSIYDYLKNYELNVIENYNEIFGQGIDAVISSNRIRIGKKSWIYHDDDKNDLNQDSFSDEAAVYVSINEESKGCFLIKSRYRESSFDIINELSNTYKVVILSGDLPADKEILTKNINKNVEMYFEQKPADKLNFIKNLQNLKKKVMMVGDGLNDSGALNQSDTGVAVTDNTSNFTPGSDAILNVSSINQLPAFLKLSKKTVQTVYMSYTLSILYNLVGFTFALTGNLSPVIAAILMPLSSISVVVFTILKTTINGQTLKLK